MRIPSILMRKSFERAGVATEVFKVCAALFNVSTTRKITPGWPIGRPIGWSGALYRRVAPLYRRVTHELTDSVNALPGASRGLPGASLGVLTVQNSAN